MQNCCNFIQMRCWNLYFNYRNTEGAKALMVNCCRRNLRNLLNYIIYVITQEDVGVVRIPSLSHSSGIMYTKKSAQKLVHKKVCTQNRIVNTKESGHK